jgi:hypothetical protein
VFVSVYDSDVLEYSLYVDGVLIDQYNSAPDYWDAEEWPDHPAEPGKHGPEPAGGDASTLCRAFDAVGRTAQVDAVLHTTTPGPMRHTSMDAFHQHWALAEALGWPGEACVTDFRYLLHEGTEPSLLQVFGGVAPIRTAIAIEPPDR